MASFAMRWIAREMRVGNAVAFGAGLAISAGLAGFTLWGLAVIGLLRAERRPGSS